LGKLNEILALKEISNRTELDALAGRAGGRHPPEAGTKDP
jgi:hypothetical protein